MVGKPQVYLLDEITSSLDEQNAREMEEILLAEDASQEPQKSTTIYLPLPKME